MIYWSEEDRCFIGEVPELQACMADGQSYQEAVRNVDIIIDESIATAQELVGKFPNPQAS